MDIAYKESDAVLVEKAMNASKLINQGLDDLTIISYEKIGTISLIDLQSPLRDALKYNQNFLRKEAWFYSGYALARYPWSEEMDRLHNSGNQKGIMSTIRSLVGAVFRK